MEEHCSSPVCHIAQRCTCESLLAHTGNTRAAGARRGRGGAIKRFVAAATLLRDIGTSGVHINMTTRTLGFVLTCL